ncbi:hypothetical protein T484DRAFT_1975538 [Baffinella frigidus]|nr:hypothetical protein T484DRAFT_1975538 [Cryptophyta sp. CCMP2293]
MGCLAVVALAGMSTIAHRPTELLEGHITRTPSRVPDIPIYGMGYNDILGVKPICTEITNKAGLVDCVPAGEEYTPLMGGSSTDELDMANGVAPDNCNAVCYYCRTSTLSGGDCTSCSCGLSPPPLRGDPLDSLYI